MEERVARMNIEHFEKLLKTEADPEELVRIRQLLAFERVKLARLEHAQIAPRRNWRR